MPYKVIQDLDLLHHLDKNCSLDIYQYVDVKICLELYLPPNTNSWETNAESYLYFH